MEGTNNEGHPAKHYISVDTYPGNFVAGLGRIRDFMNTGGQCRLQSDTKLPHLDGYQCASL